MTRVVECRRLKSSRWRVLAPLILLLVFTTPPSSGNESAGSHQDKANALFSQKKYDQSLDQFAAACLEVKNDRVERSLPAFILYQDYDQALKLAGMNDEADALSKALASNKTITSSYVADLNREAVTLLNQSKFIKAIEKLNQCLKLDRSNTSAKGYLVTAYNNAGLQFGTKQPLEALPMFRKGLVIDPDNKIMRSNLNSVLQVLGKNPADFAQRVTMGDGLLRSGDDAGAYVEYAEALRLKEDPTARTKLNAVPKSDAIFSFQISKATETATSAKPQEKPLQKPIMKPTENRRQNAVHLALDSGIASLRSFYQRIDKETKVEELFKEAAASKDKALNLISQANDIAPSTRVKERFDEAVTALGKKPSSQNDLLELAINEKKAGNFQSTIFVLNQAPDQENANDSFKNARRSAYAFLIAQQVTDQRKPQVQSSPYKLFARKSSIKTVLQMNFTIKELLQPENLPSMPDSVDLANFMDKETVTPSELPPTIPSTRKADQAKQAGAPGGMDDCIPTGVNADTELINLSNLINKDSDNDALRVRESVLLVQYGNSILKSGGNAQNAANKYRQALYILPANTAATKKLNDCLAAHGIDPRKPIERLSLFNTLYDSGLKEAALAELREFSELSQDGPSLALFGACQLEDSTESTEGYLGLLYSLNQKWETGTESSKALVHLMISELLQRDAERARIAVDNNRRLRDLQKLSLHLKQASLLDRNNSQARERLLEVAKEAARINNSATNNLFLAGAYLIQGDRQGAGECYATAASLSPKDPVVQQAYDKFKSLESK